MVWKEAYRLKKKKSVTKRTSKLLGQGARQVALSGREWSLRASVWAVINRESLLEQCAQQGHGPLGVPGIGIFSVSLAYS